MYCQRCGNSTEPREIDGPMRPVCVSCGAVTWIDPKLAVAVVIQRDGRVLLGRRGAGVREPGKWSLPAGFVERGEVVEHAAIREIAEEIGLEITVGPVLGVWSEAGEPVVLVVYPALTALGEPEPADDVAEIGWFAPDEMPELAFAHDSEILSAWERWRATRAVV